MLCHELRPNEPSVLCCTGPVKPAGHFFPGWNSPPCSLSSHTPPLLPTHRSHSQPRVMESAGREHFSAFPPSSISRSRARGNPVQARWNQAEQTRRSSWNVQPPSFPGCPRRERCREGRRRDQLAASPRRGMQGKALPANQQLRLGLLGAGSSPAQQQPHPPC